MTPEKARTLLEDATPGPWRTTKESGCGCCMRVEASSALVCIPDIDDAPLVAAAPDLAELVAGLKYEYAVQVPVNGHWEYTKDDQYGPEVSRNHRDATWYSSRRAAAIWADLWDDGEEAPRVVRRLVGDPEVAEWDG